MVELRLLLLGLLLTLSLLCYLFSEFCRQGFQAIEERDIVPP